MHRLPFLFYVIIRSSSMHEQTECHVTVNVCTTKIVCLILSLGHVCFALSLYIPHTRTDEQSFEYNMRGECEVLVSSPALFYFNFHHTNRTQCMYLVRCTCTSICRLFPESNISATCS